MQYSTDAWKIKKLRQKIGLSVSASDQRQLTAKSCLLRLSKLTKLFEFGLTEYRQEIQ